MTDQLLDELVQNASFAADMVAMRSYGTEAARIRAVIREALEMLLGNGLIQITPADQWPEWLKLDAPYDQELW